AAEPAAGPAIDEGGAGAALVIPPGATRDRLSGRGERLQVVLDGSDPNRTTVTGAAASRYFGDLGERLARERLATAGRAPPAQLVLVPRVAFNPRLKTPPFMVPGIAAMLLVIVTAFTSAMGLAREREMGTLEQVLVTPIRPLLLLVGKMAPFVVIGLFDVTLLVAAGTWLFEVPIRGSLGLFYLGTALYLVSTLGMGLLISTVSASQQQAFLGAFLFTIPAVLLSGLMTPIRAMPGWLQPITWVNPIRWFAEISRGILLRGSGLAELWLPFLALAVIGVAILTSATLRFHRRIA
ncbi:MAG TPA: ABC transporter permease, partial [Anaeromyxobacter sp.]|nr:ABC transporter permease [Anaeromyxobacter sp.]